MVTVEKVKGTEGRNDAFRVRSAVFVGEQGVPPELELDELEDEAEHIVVYSGSRPIGAGRVRLVDGAGKLERICVLAEYRSQGIGQMIVRELESIARSKGAAKAKLNSQTHAEPFYAKLGYVTVSAIFMDAGMPHVTMVKEL
ncbi:GNAT family N-acetyltransferase [Paenibacillus humicola]|uniref:GNAT family N-acetyltransferase n=1 Tax=Paenibacillus humicola TaxID=3110540 RepID=UPI00237AB419|nr:GNAT family N-acetyltransferase [Paenibacillus humicola]